MHQPSVFGDRPYWPLLQRLAVVAATIVAGLLACGALLAALGAPVPSALASGPVTYPGSAPCNTTLQACIDGSVTGTTIVVQPNTYITNALTLNRAVSLTGVSSATVILQAMSNQRVLSVTGGAVNSSVIISGLTFAGGHVALSGGAIWINATAQPLLINLTITNNVADQSGGGLFANSSGSPLVMTGVAVLSNTALVGGGAYALGNVTLNGGLFQNNHCTGASCAGGGLYAGNNLIATNTQFVSNTSTGNGGGASVIADAVLNGSLFQNNQCIGANCQGGGGLYALNNLTATNTQFLSNTILSNTSLGSGGGALVQGIVTLNGGLFQNNQCTAALCQGGGLFAGVSLAVTNTEFLTNTSDGSGGGAYATGIVTLGGGLFQSNQCTGTSCTGGGLYAGGDMALSGTQILSNTSTSNGGGTYANGDVTRLNGGLFQNNQCNVFCGGGGLLANGDLIATGTQFLSNTSTGGVGGGVYATGIVTLNGGLFQNNQCTAANCFGGGLWAEGLALSSTQFLSNTSTGYGGGIFVNATLAVTNSVFLGNRGQKGAGLYHNSGDGRLVNDLFAANQAGGQGDALFLASPGSVAILHNTIASPTLGSGAAIFVVSGTVGITDTIIASYTTGISQTAGSVFQDYNLFFGNGTNTTGTVNGGAHSLTGNPRFVNPAAGNYHLAPGSAAIDAGVDVGIAFDIDGDPRPLGNGFDIGYDEIRIWRLFLPLVLR